MDLTEAEDIKKRWQEYTEELYKKDLHDPDDHDGMITHLEPDILECTGIGLGFVLFICGILWISSRKSEIPKEHFMQR